MFEVGALGSGLEKALGVAGVLDQLIFLQRAAVLSDELLLVIDPEFMSVGLEGKHFVGMGERDAVAIGFELDEALGSAFHGGQDAGVIIDGRQREQKGLLFLQEEIDGSLARSAMEAAVGHLVSPGRALVVDIGQGGEGSAHKEVFFDIAHISFDDAFFVWASDVADRGVKEIVFGEVDKPRIELDGCADAAADNARKVVIPDSFGDSRKEVEGMEVAG